MNAPANGTTCSGCGSPIDETLDVGASRWPCKVCGNTRRTIHASVVETMVARDGIHMKAKRPGQKRPYVEDMSAPSFSVSRQKHVHRSRVIDRDNDKYMERVTDYESGEVIHEDQGKLSEHVGHGTARRAKSKP